jgi:hypothetical protein
LYYSRERNSGDVEIAMYRNAGIVTTPACLPTITIGVGTK